MTGSVTRQSRDLTSRAGASPSTSPTSHPATPVRAVDGFLGRLYDSFKSIELSMGSLWARPRVLARRTRTDRRSVTVTALTELPPVGELPERMLAQVMRSDRLGNPMT